MHSCLHFKLPKWTYLRNKESPLEYGICCWVIRTYSPLTNCLGFDPWRWVWRSIKSPMSAVSPFEVPTNQRGISLLLVEWVNTLIMKKNKVQIFIREIITSNVWEYFICTGLDSDGAMYVPIIHLISNFLFLPWSMFYLQL